VVDELKGLDWPEGELAASATTDPHQLALAARRRREATLTVAQIAQQLPCGSWKSLTLYQRNKAEAKGKQQ
jgi:hypothetical protein